MMSDFSSEAFAAPPQRLARLLASTQANEGEWLAGELGAVLCHQLSVPIQKTGSTPASNLDGCAGIEGGIDIKTFGELFQHPCPPVALLEQVKEFAKVNREHPDSALPQDISLVLYYASIVAALVRLGKRITSLDDAALRQGIEWILELPWLDASLRVLFGTGLAALEFTARDSGEQTD